MTLLWAVTPAQTAAPPAPAQVQIQGSDRNPIYKVTINVVERSVKAVNYKVRGGPTPVDFRGTALLPAGKGDAWIESKKGYIEIHAHFDKLRPPSIFGPEYLTYVLWAITPEGRATNLGEIVLTSPDDNDGELEVTTELQAFGLIVTAEPYFAVAQPSDVVVMENMIRKDTEGTVEQIDAKFDLLKRGQYAVNAVPAELKPAAPLGKTPLDLAEARNAVHIATWAGAQQNAPDILQKARSLLAQAETEHRKGEGKKTSTFAREAVQTAEDARLVTLKRIEESRIAAEHQAAVNRELAAKAQAEQEARLRADSERARAQADLAQRLEAERRMRAEAEERAAKEKAELARAEADRVKAMADERAERERIERARIAAEAKAEQERAEAAQAARLEADRAAERARLEAEHARLEADRAGNEARMALERAEREKAELRANLSRQLSLVLETRDTARGLIVSLSDVLFDTAQHTLKPGAREKLAKVSGILLSHPGLSLKVEGHADSVGTDEYNQALSDRRAGSVRDFLVSQGISAFSITARGFGESQPVATNDTPEGRQQNRRVELVVSGELIGEKVSQTLP